MKRKDYYKILGVPSYADAATIKKTYRKLALEYHPDRRPGDTRAAEKFRDIAEAYGVLGNPKKRANYDRQRMGDITYSRPYEEYHGQRVHDPRDPTGEWTPPRPSRTPHRRTETEGLFKYAHLLSFVAFGSFGLLLACYFFWAISDTRADERQNSFNARNGQNMRAAWTVTAQVERRRTQDAPTRTPLTATLTPVVVTDGLMERRQLNELPAEWDADNQIGAACYFDLIGGDETCTALGAIEILYHREDALLIRANFDPAQTDYRRVLFVVQYSGRTPIGWTVNIGDSRSNDGYGGDGGHQANNAELRINGTQMMIYGRNNEAGRSPILVQVEEAAESRGVIALEVGNEQVRWWQPAGGTGDGMFIEQVTSPYLFALDGQADAIGGVNYEVYAAFNRVIDGGAARNGRGVVRVDVRLLP